MVVCKRDSVSKIKLCISDSEPPKYNSDKLFSKIKPPILSSLPFLVKYDMKQLEIAKEKDLCLSVKQKIQNSFQIITSPTERHNNHKNPFLALCIIFFALAILAFIIGTVSLDYGAEIIFSLFAFALIILSITFLILWLATLIVNAKDNRSKQNAHHLTNKVNNRDLWLVVGSLIVSIISIIPIISNPFSALATFYIIFLLASLAFFYFLVKWFARAKQPNEYNSDNEANKKRMVFWITSFTEFILLFWLNLNNPDAFFEFQFLLPILLIAALVLFIIWLVHLIKQRKKSTGSK